ncbi:MAG: SDR family oxidoreductase [Alphaproteobacteria bacterium]|nr:SDR family oxidoreductase [Alphaproteobacteria bacterium]
MTALEAKKAIITGGGSGIGAAIARRFVLEGADVVIMGRNEARLAAASVNLGARAIACDVTDKTSVSRAFEQAGRCDILINNAGAVISKPFIKTSLDDFRTMLDVNLTGAFLCCKAVAGTFGRDAYGRIINIASTAGLRGYPYVSAYVAAKHGLIGLTRALALEFAATRVTVNAICPGFTATDLLQRAAKAVAEKTGRSYEQAVSEFARYNPQGRLVRPDDVAGAAVWLCSEEASAVTGQSLSISGGEVM